MDNKFDKFCPPEAPQSKNARAAVLENFREISRIMTQNFLSHKKIEQRYNKSAIPRAELTRMRMEGEAQQRMTNILKMMHSPSNFSGQETLLPGQKRGTAFSSKVSMSPEHRSIMAQK